MPEKKKRTPPLPFAEKATEKLQNEDAQSGQPHPPKKAASPFRETDGLYFRRLYQRKECVSGEGIHPLPVDNLSRFLGIVRTEH